MELLLYLSFLLLLIWIAASIVSWTIRNGISPMPTAPAASKTLFSNLTFLNLVEGKVYELGSGWGTLLFPLAKEFHSRSVIGYENSLFPYLVSALRKKFAIGQNVQVKREDFFKASLKDGALIVCYLYPGAMAKLKIKFEKELKPGSFVVSNTFTIPGWTPYDVWRVNDLYDTKIYVYRIPSSIPKP